MCFRQKTKQSKKIDVGLYSDIHQQISFALCGMIRRTKLYILIIIWITLTFTEGQNCMRKKTCSASVHFLRNFEVDSDEIWYAATTCWFVEAHAKLIMHKYYLRERTLLTWFYKLYNYHYPMSGHTWTDFFFCFVFFFFLGGGGGGGGELGMMRNTIKHSSLMFSQGHRVTAKQNLCCHSAEELHESTQLFMLVYYVKEMTVKKCCMKNIDRLSICSSCCC